MYMHLTHHFLLCKDEKHDTIERCSVWSDGLLYAHTIMHLKHVNGYGDLV